MADPRQKKSTTINQNSYLSHRIKDSFPRILKFKKYKSNKTGINFMIYFNILGNCV